jgi:hypothetical protein
MPILSPAATMVPSALMVSTGSAASVHLASRVLTAASVSREGCVGPWTWESLIQPWHQDSGHRCSHSDGHCSHSPSCLSKPHICVLQVPGHTLLSGDKGVLPWRA